MTAVARVAVALLLSLVVPAGPMGHPARAAESVSIEDTQGRLIWGKGSDVRSPWSDRNVWIDGTWIWSAHPIDEPSKVHLQGILIHIQSTSLLIQYCVSEYFVQGHSND